MYSPGGGEGGAWAILVPVLWFPLSHQLGNQSWMPVSLPSHAGMKSGLCVSPALYVDPSWHLSGSALLYDLECLCQVSPVNELLTKKTAPHSALCLARANTDQAPCWLSMWVGWVDFYATSQIPLIRYMTVVVTFLFSVTKTSGRRTSGKKDLLWLQFGEYNSHWQITSALWVPGNIIHLGMLTGE